MLTQFHNTRFFILLTALIATALFSFTNALAVNQFSQEDIGVVSIDSPTMDGIYGDDVAFTFTVRNFDTTDKSNTTNFRYRVNNGPWTNKSGFQFIPAGGTAQFSVSSFGSGLDLAIPGEYKIQVETVLAADVDSSNNQSSVTITSLPEVYANNTVDVFPYIEDFESGAGGWQSSAPEPTAPSVWELGLPQGPTIDEAASGSNSWITDADAPHAMSSRSSVVSPIFDLTGIPLVNISLSVWWESSPRASGAKLQKSTDEGTTWTTVGAAGDPENWYSSSNVLALDYTGDQDGWAGYDTAGSYIAEEASGPFADPYYSSGSMTSSYPYASSGSGEWLTASNIMSAGEPTRLRVLFASTPSGSDDGFAFDDFMITPGVALTQIDALQIDSENPGIADIGDTVRYTATFQNLTSGDINDVMFNNVFAGTGLKLVAGTVTTSSGSVTLGNTGGDAAVQIDIGTVSSSATVTVSFDVMVDMIASESDMRCNQSVISAAEFDTAVLSSDDPDTAANIDSTCFMVTTTDFDMDGIPDGMDPDDDNDGISDVDEIASGTNPRDAGSGSSVLSSTFCSEWNGFLGLLNVNEYSSTAGAELRLDITLFDNAGNAQSDTAAFVLANSQTDVLVHGLNGFQSDAYGRTCTTVSGGAPGDILGRTVLYHPDSVDGGFDFALSTAFSNSSLGSQFVPFNTFGLGGKLVANWVSISNPDSTPLQGQVLYYGQDGSLLGSENTTIPANGRSDFAAHQFGANLIGLLEWKPSVSTRAAIVRNVRYFFDNAGESATFDTAMQIDAIKGTGEQIVVALDKTEGNAVIELSNTTNSPIVITATFRDSDGTLRATETVGFAARQTGHIVADSIIESDIGSVTLQSNVVGSLIAVATHYSRVDESTLLNAYATVAKQAKGSTLKGSYNTFIEQGCDLIMTNVSSAAVNLSLSLTRFDGTTVLPGELITIPAKGTSNYDLCSNDFQDNYGSVVITPSVPDTVTGHIVRNGKDNRYRFVTEVTR